MHIQVCLNLPVRQKYEAVFANEKKHWKCTRYEHVSFWECLSTFYCVVQFSWTWERSFLQIVGKLWVSWVNGKWESLCAQSEQKQSAPCLEDLCLPICSLCEQTFFQCVTLKRPQITFLPFPETSDQHDCGFSDVQFSADSLWEDWHGVGNFAFMNSNC